MRQIFSVILAAALVFGGTLFMAGYFESIERTRLPLPMPEGPHPAHGSGAEPVDRGSLWHCPEVERVMAGPLPGIFEMSEEDRALIGKPEVIKEGELSHFTGTRWGGVSLQYLFEVGDRKVKGKTITCTYWNADRARSLKLTVIPDLYGEITLDPRVDGGWGRWIGTDCAAPAFGCRGSVQECGFYVHQTDVRIRELKTRDDEPCLWPPLDLTEVPVERGGRATGGGD